MAQEQIHSTGMAPLPGLPPMAFEEESAQMVLFFVGMFAKTIVDDRVRTCKSA
jgi:hypothetical protein